MLHAHASYWAGDDLERGDGSNRIAARVTGGVVDAKSRPPVEARADGAARLELGRADGYDQLFCDSPAHINYAEQYHFIELYVPPILHKTFAGNPLSNRRKQNVLKNFTPQK